MSTESKRVAGAILIILPTVMIGGVSILTLLIGTPEYMRNPIRQDLWRAGHAHAGVFLLLTLIALRYVDEASLSYRSKEGEINKVNCLNGIAEFLISPPKWFVRLSIPSAAILLPVHFSSPSLHLMPRSQTR